MGDNLADELIVQLADIEGRLKIFEAGARLGELLDQRDELLHAELGEVYCQLFLNLVAPEIVGVRVEDRAVG